MSKDPPSDYPDFEGLADRVGGRAHPRHDEESFEVYLGRLVSSGVKVHDEVRQILSSPNSAPNPNHFALIDLFKNQDCFRLVTTNFDTHFATAARERFGTGPEVFYAPALPIGSGFTGIVNLHGSVDREPNRMVLTDSDFARAYINEGWATRFLERLFSHFVVLFIGYRHRDTLMTYLARGLTSGSPGPGRFVLTPPDDDTRWENLGIVPVHYPTSEPPQLRHAQLTIAISAWAEQCQAGALAVENRIRTIVTGIAPSSEEEDFLRDALSEISRLRFFTRHARDPKWLIWAERQSQFQAIFATRDDYSETDWELAAWFGENYVVQHADKALDIIRRRGRGLSPLVWRHASLALFRAKAQGNISADILSKWVTVLVATAAPGFHDDNLEYVLSHCKYPDDARVALLLFEHLTRPRLSFKEALRWPGKDTKRRESIDMEVECGGSEHWLAKAWNDIFAPNLNALARQVSTIVSSHLNYARRLHIGFEKSTSFDRLSFSRGMVESRSQDHLRSGFSVLVDAAAAVLEWSAQHNHQWLTALSTDWFESDSPLLRRLAIYATAISAHVGGDEKLIWVIEKGLLHEPGIRHELFLVLQRAYPQASKEVRGRFLTAIQERFDIHDENAEGAAFGLYNMLNWLAKSDPNCELVATLLDKVKEEHPMFRESTHPDLDHWIGGVGWGTADASDDLTSCNLRQLLEALETAKDGFYPEVDTKDKVIRSIGHSAQKSHEWGISIAREAQQASIWLIELWQPLLSAWAATDLNEEEWASVLNLLDASSPIYKTNAPQLTWLLERGIQNSSKPIPTNLLPRAKSVADKVWATIEEPEQISGDIDWLGRAINHPAGQIFQFYVQSLARSQQPSSPPQPIAEEYKVIFNEAIVGSSLAAQLARVVLASQVHFLFNLDPDWTTHSVFPILDPKLNEERAKQCWNGYLYWGRWTDAMLQSLMQCYENMFSVIDKESDETRRMFCGHLSGIGIYSSIHPLDSGWLFRFLQAVQDKTRSLWAGEFGLVMAGLDADAKLHLWKRWLNDYWRERVMGKPAPLSGKEAAHMVEWALDLEPVFSEALDLVRKSVYPEFEHSMIYYRISESPLVENSPDAMVDLLVFLTEGEHARHIYDRHRLYIAVERLVGRVPRNRKLRDLCDRMALLGVQGGAALASRLDPPYQVG